MRSDSILNTGLTSISVTKVSEERKRREERAKAKEDKRAVMAPSIEPVLEELRKEKEKTVQSLLSVISPTTPHEDVKSLVVSLNLYADSMDKLKSRLSNIMRITKPVSEEGSND